MDGQFIVAPYPDAANPMDILFQVSAAATGEIPPEQAALKSDVERTLSVLRGLFPPADPKFRKYFDELLSLAQYGLVGSSAQPSQAQGTLKNFQIEFFDQEKSRAVSRYIFKTARSFLMFAGSAALLAVLTGGLMQYYGYPQIAPTLYYLPATLSGLGLGVIFSSFLRCKAVDFYDLHVIEADRFTANTKSMFSIVVLAIAAIFLKAKIIDISIGDVKFQDFDTNFLAAVSFGTVVGVAQEAIISSIESIRSKAGAQK